MARWLTLSVTLEDRDGGGLHVSSEQLPGLILSGSDKRKIANAIPLAIKALLERDGFRNVSVHPSAPLARAEEENENRQEQRQFVIEVEEIAA